MRKSNIIITIDTEVGEMAKSNPCGFEQFVMGQVQKLEIGVPKILESLHQNRFSAEFFVDVYEQRVFGEDKYRKLCQTIYDTGSSVQLHTHPGYMYDKSRIFMHEYTLDEQIKIISDGKNLIEKWIGSKSKAHRAGNYGANNNTLYALEKNNIFIDSSFFYQNRKCKIELKTVNDSLYFNDVLEIPVTVTKKYGSFSSNFPWFYQWQKLDINLSSYQEIIKALSRLKTDIITLFLHSSSFVNRDKTQIIAESINYSDFKKFDQLLKYLKNHNYNVVTYENLGL